MSGAPTEGSLQNSLAFVRAHENAQFQEKVLTILPLERLRDTALSKGSSEGLTFHEHLAKEVNIACCLD